MIMANRANQVTRHGGVLWIFNNHAVLIGRPLTSGCSFIFFFSLPMELTTVACTDFFYMMTSTACAFLSKLISNVIFAEFTILFAHTRFFWFSVVFFLLLPLVKRLNEVVDRHAAACNQTQLDLTCLVRVCGQVVIKCITIVHQQIIE